MPVEGLKMALSLTNAVPLEPAAARKAADERIHQKPRPDDEEKPDEDVAEHLFCTFDLVGLPLGRHVLPPCPGEKDRRHDDRKENTVIEDVLGQLRKIADRLASSGLRIAILRYDRGEPALSERHHRQDSGKKDWEKQNKSRQLSGECHTNIVA